MKVCINTVKVESVTERTRAYVSCSETSCHLYIIAVNNVST